MPGVGSVSSVGVWLGCRSRSRGLELSTLWIDESDPWCGQPRDHDGRVGAAGQLRRRPVELTERGP